MQRTLSSNKNINVTSFSLYMCLSATLIFNVKLYNDNVNCNFFFYTFLFETPCCMFTPLLWLEKKVHASCFCLNFVNIDYPACACISD